MIGKNAESKRSQYGRQVYDGELKCRYVQLASDRPLAMLVLTFHIVTAGGDPDHHTFRPLDAKMPADFIFLFPEEIICRP